MILESVDISVLQDSSRPPKINKRQTKNTALKQRRKQDALDLAELIYDMFKEEEVNVDDGQNNAGEK